MTLEEAILAKLVADPTMAGLVGDRVYPISPEKTAFPFLIYQLGESLPDEASASFDGPGFFRSHLALSSYGKTWKDSRALLGAAAALLAPPSCRPAIGGFAVETIRVLNGPRDVGFEENAEAYRFDCDFEIVHN